MSLADLLGMGPSNGEWLKRVVLVDVNRKRLGLEVDGTGEELEAYIKPLSSPLSRMRGVSGVTILGNGRPVFLIDLPSLLQ
jgi:two-component system chemotaxis sensor kinase CheA